MRSVIRMETPLVRFTSEIEGKVERIAIGVPENIVFCDVQEFYAQVLSKLIRADGSGPLIEALTHVLESRITAIKEAIDRYGNQNVRDLAFGIPEVDSGSIWLRDLLLISIRKEFTHLVHSSGIGAISPFQLATIRKNTMATDAQSPFKFEGGNILAGRDFFLVGEDIQRINEDLNLATWEDLNQKKILLVGRDSSETPSKQPIFHIDIFFSLGGEVICPDGKTRYLIMRGLPREFQNDFDPCDTDSDLPMGAQPEDFEAIFKNLLQLDPKISFCGMTLPLIYLKFEDVEMIRRIMFTDIEPENGMEIREAWNTYNNVLTEIDVDTRRVWMPTYSVNPTLYENHPQYVPRFCAIMRWMKSQDLMAQAVWEAAGFEVIPVGPMLFWTLGRGALRCVVNELERSKPQGPIPPFILPPEAEKFGLVW